MKWVIIFLLLLLPCRAMSDPHPFTGLPMTVDGWTDLSALVQTNSRIVYVSVSDGVASPSPAYYDNTLTNPFNPSDIQAYSTIAAAEAQMRDGYPDILLLKRGDDFGSGNTEWDKSGESATRPMIVAAYGDESLPRPIIGQFNIVTAGIDFLVLAHLQLDDEEASARWRGPLNYVLIEGCLMPPGSGGGMAIQHDSYGNGNISIDYLSLRRNVVAGRFRPSGAGGYVSGIYIDHAGNNLLIEENVFDDNGRDEFDLPSATNDQGSHNTYVMLNGATNVIWRYNITSRASSHGIQAGNGGHVYGNLSVQDPIAIQLAREDSWLQGVTTGNVEKNVILHGADTSSLSRRGWGIIAANVNGLTIDDNIIGLNTESTYPRAFGVSNQVRDTIQMRVRNVTWTDNIVHLWDGDPAYTDGHQFMLDAGDAAAGTNEAFVFTGNWIHSTNSGHRLILTDTGVVTGSSNNRFYGLRTAGEQFRIGDTQYDLAGYMAAVSDTTSTATQTTPLYDYGITDYLTSIGETAALASFYTNLRAQRKGNWDTRYTAVPIINFVRAAFSRDAVVMSYATGDSGGDVCDASHLNLCLTEGDCTGAGGYWYNSACNASPQPAATGRPTVKGGRIKRAVVVP